VSISKTAEKRGYVREETLRLFQDIVTFGYELTYATPKNVLNTELRQLFFSEMYCERPLLEEKLRAFCTSQGAGLGVVIGVQGSGKSTIVQVVQSQLDPSHFPFLLINFIFIQSGHSQVVNESTKKKVSVGIGEFACFIHNYFQKTIYIFLAGESDTDLNQMFDLIMMFKIAAFLFTFLFHTDFQPFSQLDYLR